jgi:hypothetical protein
MDVMALRLTFAQGVFLRPAIRDEGAIDALALRGELGA